MILLFVFFGLGIAAGWFWRKDEERMQRLEHEALDRIETDLIVADLTRRFDAVWKEDYEAGKESSPDWRKF
jgi:hypothetical protein